jgi:type II secretory pathway component PulF
MKYEEFAFFNRQLAAMVRDGIPLERALERLCAEMRRGPLQTELQKLGEDLAKGTPLRQAVQGRQLPDLYCQMLEVGAQANDLPAVLTLLADHYQQRQNLWARLKGLMVYPTIVLFGTLVLSCFLSLMLSKVVPTLFSFGAYEWGTRNNSVLLGYPWVQNALIGIWAPPFLLGIATAICVVAVTAPRARRALRWRLPAFKEASLAQTASALALMVKNGVALDKAIGLVEQLERGTPAAAELALWRQRLAGGQGKFSAIAGGGRVFPPLFVWMVEQSGEDLAAGFQRAAEIYQSRASYRAEALLYSALPCSVLALGLVILCQIRPALVVLVELMNSIGDNTG